MKSLRARLFILLATTTLLVWSSAAAWIFVHTRSEVQRVLDRRLVEAAGMVASLAQNTQSLATRQQSRIIPLSHYSRQLSCQIWTLDGRLVGRSNGAPSEPLSSGGSGMSERLVDGDTWRVYSIIDAKSGIRVSVGDNLRVRQRLIRDLMEGLLLPAVIGLAALAFLIWAAVGAGLRPLKGITRRLRQRDPSDFSPLAIDWPTSEVLPLIEAIDDRSRKLAQVRDTERHFIASAAHELQTPLAGLRTHAQIARRTTDAKLREQSLVSIEQSVDRSARMVQQLLDLARHEMSDDYTAPEWLRLGELVDLIREEFVQLLTKKQMAIVTDPDTERAIVCAGRIEFMLALKNLIKNAIDYGPGATSVEVGIARNASEVGVTTTDQGEGIPENELHTVRARFHRGSSNAGSGSGLGLSIVELVMTRMDARLELRNLLPSGFRATIWMPPSRVR